MKHLKRGLGLAILALGLMSMTAVQPEIKKDSYECFIQADAGAIHVTEILEEITGYH